MMTFVIQALRSICFSLDKIIYGLIDDVYSLLMLIARTTIFDDATIAQFASRIYAIAGIFMLFKVSLSIIQYVINPDMLTEKDKGFGALGKRIVTSLILLVLCPYLFQEAYELQAIILQENTLMNLVFGTTSVESTPVDDYAVNAGKNIQFTVMYTFLQPNYEEFYLKNKDDISLASCEYTYDEKRYFREGSKFIRALHSPCFGEYDKESDLFGDNGDLPKAFFKYGGEKDGLKVYQNYAQGIAQQDFNLLMRSDIVLIKDDSNNYIINYRYGVSTLAGAAVVYIFLLFCIDIAVRSVKLSFLEIIAPIPILSYIEVKGKDGMFKKWYQMCFTTYISLFLRLFSLYLGIYAITAIGGYTDSVTGKTVKGGWLFQVFMILGILMFVKQLPKIIEDIFGVKLDGKFSLNPFKRIQDEALFGKQAVSLAAVPLVGASSLVTGRGLRGVGKAFVGGLRGEKFGKNFASSYAAAREAHKKAQERRADGVSAWSVGWDKFYNATHGMTKTEKIDRVTSGLKAIQDDYASYEKTAAGVDAIAKEMDKRKKAAEAAGDYAETKKWSDAFDARVKQIASNHGRVASSFSGDLSLAFDASGNYDGSGIRVASGDVSQNAALVNIGDHMDALVASMNEQGSSIDGYIAITGKVATDIKKIKNQALGSQQSVETDEATRKAKDVAKYSGGKKK